MKISPKISLLPGLSFMLSRLYVKNMWKKKIWVWVNQTTYSDSSRCLYLATQHWFTPWRPLWWVIMGFQWIVHWWVLGHMIPLRLVPSISAYSCQCTHLYAGTDGWKKWEEEESSGRCRRGKKAPPRFELGLLDSKSNVVTTRLWGQTWYLLYCNYIYL